MIGDRLKYSMGVDTQGYKSKWLLLIPIQSSKKKTDLSPTISFGNSHAIQTVAVFLLNEATQ